MPQMQLEALDSLVHSLRYMAEELHIANQLKALELKANPTPGISPEMVDDIINK